MDGNTATYRQLNSSEIRLISIHAGRWDDILSCSLEYIQLETEPRPEYAALSYAWGDATDTIAILLNGTEHQVTRGLFTALRRLRWFSNEVPQDSRDRFQFKEFNPCDKIRVWADALCINQLDRLEKEREIPRMAEIYSQCKWCCAWLGDSDADSQLEMGILRACAEYLRTPEFHAANSGTIKDGKALKALERFFGDRYDDLKSALFNLVTRPWFQRTWVTQEVALPTVDPILITDDILFKIYEFFWIWDLWMKEEKEQESTVLRTEHWNLQRGGVHNAATMSIIRASSQIRARVRRAPAFYSREEKAIYGPNPIVQPPHAEAGKILFELLLQKGVGTSFATLPHDHMYSLLGLIGNVAHERFPLPAELRPDYTKSFPRVFQEYARFAIESTGNINIILREGSNSHTQDAAKEEAIKGPSWVPNFCNKCHTPKAFKGSPSEVSFGGEDGQELHIQGRDLGEIVSFHIPSQKEMAKEEDDRVVRLQRWDEFLHEVATQRQESYENTLSRWVNALHDNPDKEGFKSSYLRLLSGNIIDGSSSPPSPDSHTVADLQRNTSESCGVRVKRYFRSATKWTVLCADGKMAVFTPREPCEARKGDRLVAVSSCLFPLVLRGAGSSTSGCCYYTLVGWCGSIQTGGGILRIPWEEYRAEGLEEFVIV